MQLAHYQSQQRQPHFLKHRGRQRLRHRDEARDILFHCWPVPAVMQLEAFVQFCQTTETVGPVAGSLDGTPLLAPPAVTPKYSAAALRRGVSESRTDFETALAEAPDAITVSTPPSSHQLYVERAQDLGLVFSPKFLSCWMP